MHNNLIYNFIEEGKNLGECFRKENVKDILAITPLQEGILYHSLSTDDTSLYFEQLLMDICGKIEKNAFKKAWQWVIKNNQMMRTVFSWQKLNRPVQIILKEIEFDFTYYDLSLIKEEEKKSQFKKITVEDIKRGFDLTKGPLFRIILCKWASEEYKVIISNHHIIYDGWSNGIIMKEFFTAYSNLENGQNLINSQKRPFKDYITWLQDNKVNEEQFWRNYLMNIEIQSYLPLDTKKLEKKPKIEDYHFEFALDVTEKFKNFCKINNVTAGAFLYALWGIILHKYNNIDDVIFGTTVSGRTSDLAGIEEMVGLFINTVPLRLKIDSNRKVIDFIKSVSENLQKRTPYAKTSLVDIKKYSSIFERKSLFDTLIVIENYPLDQIINNLDSTLQVESYEMNEMTNYDLTLGIEFRDYVKLKFSYNATVLKKRIITKMADYFANLFKQILIEPETEIKRLNMITENEKEQLLSGFSKEINYPENKLIYQLFHEQANKTPDEVVLEWEDKKISYAKLQKKVNQLAHYLREKGVKAEKTVGIMVKPSPELIIGILGILTAGGTYLPLDPGYPEERINYMLKDSGTDMLLSQKNLVSERISDTIDQIYFIDDEKISDYQFTIPEKINQSHNLAYIIYTSGSTGKPKGVMIEHHSIANTIYWRKNEYKLSINDTVLQLYSFSFDGFVTSFLTPLVSGASLVLVSEDDRKDPIAIKEIIKTKKVTHLCCVPSFYKSLLECIVVKDVKSLKTVALGGEKIDSILVKKSKKLKEDLKITNEYGPTENSVITTIERDLLDKITIGKPIPNIKIYILDKDLNLMPQGAIGEIYISGSGLARGYLNRPQITARHFITNPYSPDSRLYKTGDQAKWNEDGTLDFIGRVDQQVKVRGFRIEIGEIESQLLKHPDIKETVVVSRKDRDNIPYLCAYIVIESLKKKEEIFRKELRDFLSKELPNYMIPARFVRLEKMPLTPNGKIDRHRLPEPTEEIELRKKYHPPTTKLEKKLALVYTEVLDRKKIGIRDNFFELGGHSLNAISLVSVIYKKLNLKLSVKDIMNYPTIERLAEYLESKEKETYQIIPKINDKKENYSTTYAQKGIYTVYQLNKENTSFNMSGGLLIKGNLDIELLQTTFQKLIKRHQILRSSYHLEEGQVVQRIADKIDFKIEVINSKKKDLSSLVTTLVQPFKLEEPPLLRVKLIQFIKEEYLLFFDMHHIISDGLSMEILIKDWLGLYQNQPLKPLKIQYQDYAFWKSNYLKSNQVKSVEEYWLKEYSDELPTLTLPTDFSVTKNRSYAGGTLNFQINSELTFRLKELARKNETTLFMVLLAIYQLLLSRYSGQKDIIVGTPVSSRNHPDLNDLIGLFVNTIPIRSKIKGNKSFTEFLKTVKEKVLKAFEYQQYPMELLIEKLALKRENNRNSLFNTVFAMQEMEFSAIKIPELDCQSYSIENNTAKYDVTMTAIEINQLTFELEYSKDFFKEETIKRMAGHFVNLIMSVIDNPDKNIVDLEILQQNEKQQLLETFNQTEQNYPEEKTVIQLIEEQVRIRPNKKAFVYKDKSLTYGVLNQKANQLARYLKSKGLKKEEIVGIMAETSPEMLIGLVGILKAGGAFLPIDSKYPEDRIQYMLNDSQTTFLLTQSFLSMDNQKIYDGDSSNLKHYPNRTDLAYIIYTSGSTGQPKGVMIEHHSLMNLIGWHNRYFAVTDTDISVKYAGFGFDASVWEIFPYLAVGATIHGIPEELKFSLEGLNQYFEEEKVTIAFLPTQICEHFLKFENSSLKRLLTGGDKLKSYQSGNYKVYNNYGPTESTVVATSFLIDQQYENIPIGSPIDNTQLYILSEDNQLQPIGVFGELCIAGDGLARGYLNRPELTLQKFIENPYRPSEPIYKTGDLTRWLSNGTIEFAGRIDSQVQIRGYRVELGEIENHLQNLEPIDSAVVVSFEDKSGQKYLSAYIELEDKKTNIDLVKMSRFIKTELKKRIPDYMIPAYITILAQIPLTVNGKVDKNKLSKPNRAGQLMKNGRKLETELEKKIIAILKDILDLEEIGLDDNYFELGGHSLNAIQVISLLKKECQVAISLQEFFENPTALELARLVEDKEKIEYQKITRLSEQKYYQLSFSQKRLWFIYQLNPQSIAYNMPGKIRLNETVKPVIVKEVIKRLIERHESLRTNFKVVDGYPVQLIHSDYINNFTFIDLTQLKEKTRKEKLAKIEKEIFEKSFNLEDESLIRTALIKYDKDNYELYFCLHHIISDGWSIAILQQEFNLLYQAIKSGQEINLSSLEIQYKDFAAWQNELFDDEMKLQEMKEYWQKRLTDKLPDLQLPYDFSNEYINDWNTASYRVIIKEEKYQKLKDLAKDNQTSLFMVLLAGFQILLVNLTKSKDIVLGIPAASREHDSLKDVVGFFINTLILRMKIDTEKTVLEYLKTVELKTLKLLEYQSYPLELVLEELDIDYPELKVFFNMINIGHNKDKLLEERAEHKTDVQENKFELVFYLEEYANGLEIRCHYLTSLFKKATIEYIQDQYLKILGEITANPKRKISAQKKKKKKRKIQF